MSRPVICSNVYGCKEMVRNNFNGFLVKPRSSKSIYNAMKNLAIIKREEEICKKLKNLAEKNGFDENILYRSI